MKTLLRSWFFRIFAGLFMVGLGLYNLIINLEQSDAPWIYRALDAAVPYANLMLLNLGQAIVAVFLASEFLKNDRKNDTVEVIYARSMTNGEYIFGKVLGILFVFLILNILILLEGIGFSFISTDSSRSLWSLLIYPFLISLPTLLYVLGLSFLLMILFKNQAITFIILLGYIAVSVFYLDQKVYHIFDFIAYNVPMLHSNYGGYGNINEILMHRGIYFLFGLGLVFFTIARLDRLPQNRFFKGIPLVLAIVFLLTGGYLAYTYIGIKQNDNKFKLETVALNDKYAFQPMVTLTGCSLNVEHLSDKIRVTAVLQIKNNNQKALDTVLFSLNPGLVVSSIKYNSKKVGIVRNHHILQLIPETALTAGDSAVIEVHYSGNIDERACFVDLYNSDEQDNTRIEVFNIRKRYAWITSNLVCLTPSAVWYPVPGTGFSRKRPFYHSVNFTRFALNVKTTANLTAISQGTVKSESKGVFNFTCNNSIPSLSLLIGPYKKYSVNADSVQYSLYAFKGNTYFETYFKNLKDTIPFIIKELKADYEFKVGLSYPYRFFNLVEVPVQFPLESHIWSFSSEAVQPGMVLYPEKGVIMWDTDFRRRRFRERRSMKKNNEEVTPKELEVRMFKQAIRKNLLRQPDEEYLFDYLAGWNSYSIFPLYFSFTRQLQSEKWPELSLAMESYLNNRESSGSTKQRFWEDLTNEEWIIIQLRKSSLTEIVKKFEKNEPDAVKPDELRRIFLSKGRQFFDVIEAQFGREIFDSIMFNLVKGNKFKTFTDNQLSESFQKTLGISLTEKLSSWYNEKSLPGYVLSGLNTYRVVDGEKTVYQVRFEISNPTPVDGCFITSVELKTENNKETNFWEVDEVKPDFRKKFYLPAHTTREYGLVFNTQPSRLGLYTYISQNLPNSIIYYFPGFDQLLRVPVFNSVNDVNNHTITENPNEIIVDNEDPGFSVVQDNNLPMAKKWVHSRSETTSPYQSIHFWSPPLRWTPTLKSDFYGKYIRSGMYTKGGNGERTATWKTPLKQKGQYEVYFYNPGLNFFDRRNKPGEFYYTVHFDDGKQTVKLMEEDLQKGWNLLGTYFISSDTAVVELSNKTTGRMVYADAVKWVKI